MFSFMKNALFGASSSSSSKQQIDELRRENNEIKRDNEEIKGLLRELLTNKRKRDDEETPEEVETERNKRVHVEAPPVATVSATIPPPSTSLASPSTPTPLLSTSSTTPPPPSSSTPPPPPSSSTPPPPAPPSPPATTSTPTPPSSFVVSAGGSVDLNNNNNNPATSTTTTTTQSNNATSDSHNPTTTTSSHNPTTSDSNNTASNNTTITTNNNAPPKKDVMISFNCRTMTKFAEQLMEALEKTNKFDVFCCTKTLKFGEVYRVQISSATQKANIFICLLNAGWANSSETLSEYLVMEKKVNNGKGGAVFPIVFESDDNKWMDKPAVDWILSKYQGYFIKKEDTANEGTWQGHIDKCVGQLCQENF